MGPGKPLAMLAYLAVRGEARRDELISLLWGDVPEAKARNAFRQALHRLRSVLGDDILPQDRERVGLGDRSRLLIDLERFSAELDAGHPERAAEVAAGDFLEGLELGEAPFDLWVEGERSRIRARLEMALQQAAQRALQAGNATDALRFAQRFAAVAPFEEAAAMLEASVLIAAGRANEATNALKRFAARLRDELDLSLPPQSQEMLARLERSGARTHTTPASSARVPGGANPAFSGRADELTKLLAAVSDLRSERGGFIVVEGSAGIGKSRLVDEAIGRAKSLGSLLVLRGRERAGSLAVPYSGIGEALRGAIRAPGLGGASQHLLAEAARLLPELRDLFDLPAYGPLDDEAARLRFFEGIAALIDAVAYEQPVLLFLDDAHNALASTADLLGYLGARLQTSPVLIVVALRREEAPSHVIAQIGEDVASPRLEMPLAPLPGDDTAAIIRSIVGGRISGDEVSRLAGLAAGNPFRAVDLAQRAAAGEHTTAPPATLRDVLWARLQRCSPSQRRVFFAAALLQRSAPLTLLAAAAHLPESAAYDAALALEHAGLTAQTPDGYILAHDIAAVFVVEMSGTAGRALLAGWAAEALEHASPNAHAELAFLYSLAGRQSPAFTHARLGGFAALGTGAFHEAARLFGLALTFASTNQARDEVQRILNALSAGRLRLGSGESDTAAASVSADELLGEEAADAEPAALPSEKPAGAGDGTTASKSYTPPPGVAVPRARRPAIRPAIAIGATIALLFAAAAVVRQSFAQDTRERVLSDSLLVASRTGTPTGTASIVTGDIAHAMAQGSVASNLGPAWIDSVSPPWVNPLASPTRAMVALERVTKTGSDLYLVSADRRDTTLVAAGNGDNIALGWSPDGSSLLVSRPRLLAGGTFDTDLYRYQLSALTHPIPIDSSSTRSVTEAVWSPDGASIAWVARVGAERQRDVFESRADGSELRDISDNPSEEYHVAWSPDGTLLAFTSERDGNAELYAYDLAENRLWRLTHSPAQDDRAAFSPDGRVVAFESTRQGESAVYLMFALGGDARRVTPAGSPFSVIGWRGATVPYVNRVRIVGPSSVPVGDTLVLGELGIDQNGAPITLRGLTWRVENGDAGTLTARSDGRMVFRSDQAGVARIIAELPGWRADTLAVSVGAASLSVLRDSFAHGIGSDWLMLGSPGPVMQLVPSVGVTALYPNGDLEWESGVLSREAVALREGLSVQARLFAPFASPALPASRLELSLVPAMPPNQVDRTAPRFAPVVSVIWDGEAGRITYTVLEESHSESAASLGASLSHIVRYSIAADGRVVFAIDGRERWDSTLRVSDAVAAPRAQLWIGGRATGKLAAVTDVVLDYSGAASARR